MSLALAQSTIKEDAKNKETSIMYLMDKIANMDQLLQQVSLCLQKIAKLLGRLFVY